MKLETIEQKEALQVLATGGRIYALCPIAEKKKNSFAERLKKRFSN